MKEQIQNSLLIIFLLFINIINILSLVVNTQSDHLVILSHGIDNNLKNIYYL